MANKFWVGGTGTWDNSTTTHWASTTGGAGGVAVPTTGDVIAFDASSGGGTVTVDTTINGLTFTSIACGTFTGTLDFSVNNPSITLTGGSTQFSVSGSGARTIKLGSGTFTFNNVAGNQSFWDAGITTALTNPTTVANAATFQINFAGTLGGATTFAGGGLTYGTVNIGSSAAYSPISISGTNTFGTLSITAPATVIFPINTTTTITTAIAWNGSSSSQMSLRTSTTGNSGTIAVATGSVISWAWLTSLLFTGTTVLATNSFDGKSNTGVTITAPTGGTGSPIGAMVGA